MLTYASKALDYLGGALVKPTIVFFGEKTNIGQAAELKESDLLIVMGTSLSVMPFVRSYVLRA